MYKNKIKLWHSHFETALAVVVHKKLYSSSILHTDMGKKKNMLLQNWVLYNSLFSLTYDSTALKKTDTCTRNAWPAYATDLRWQNILRYHMSPLHKWKLQKMNRRTMSINRHLQKNKHAQQGVMAGGSLMQNLEEQGICSLGDLLCT